MDLPEFREAVKLENDARDAAFLDIPANICGLQIRNMTPLDFMTLDHLGSPVINGGLPSRADISDFLSFMAVKKQPVKHFWKMLRMDYGAALSEIGKYLERTYQDTPGHSSPTSGRPMASWLAFECDLLGREYGWSTEKTLNTPLRVLNQLVNCIKKRYDPDYTVHALSGRVLGDRLKKKNEELQLKLARQSLVDLLARRAN